jgi:hypothetical protein
MRILQISILFLFLAFFIFGCAPKALVSPEVDLTKYDAIGLIVFKCDAKGNLGEFVTQKFMEEISTSQKGIKIVELGKEDKVLRSIDRDTIGPKAIQLIGEKYNVGAIIMGDLKVSKIKPKISISSIIAAMSVKADVQASLIVRLIETKSGATLWTDSAEDKNTVASVNIFSKNDISFEAKDPQEAYGDLAQTLVENVTLDLKPRMKRL